MMKAKEKTSTEVKAKAKDPLGSESKWGTMPIKMPHNLEVRHGLMFQFLERFFARYPNSLPHLQQLLGL